MSEIEFNHYVRTPFAVEATLITEENIEAIADLVGTVRVKNGEKYVALDRRIVPNISRAYVGWFVTRLGDNYRCYSPKVFSEQFEPMNETMVVCFDFNEKQEDGFVPATEETWSEVSEVVSDTSFE